MHNILDCTACDVAIIGSGPTGIAAALTLKKAGISDIVIIDRETEAGGIPRHCGHPPFGLLEHKKIMTGPAYARYNIEKAKAASLFLSLKTTVTRLEKGGSISFITPDGAGQLRAKRVLLATGTRETPRSARFVSGDRALGICNTGALQSMIYLKNLRPFQSPLVVGSEVVSLSALWTCKKAGITPVAILEENKKTTVNWPLNLAPRYFGVPLFLQTKIVAIHGNGRVEAVQTVDASGRIREHICDGVLFTGCFTPESSLARLSHLAMAPGTGAPLVDNTGRCSDPVYYAAGNVIFSPVKVAGRCWQNGCNVGRAICRDLRK